MPKIICKLLFIFYLFAPTEAQEPQKISIDPIAVPPAIDGRIDDACWQVICPLTGFVQYDPVNGGPASEPTEVRLAYDCKYLYLAFKMFDAQPEKIWAELTPRNEYENNDSITIILDTYNDKRTSFEFTINPRGVQKNSVDTIWQSGAVVTADGWTAEMAIPFKSLRFSTLREQVWGILFERYIHRLHETDTWTLRLRDLPELQQTAELLGIRDVKPGYNLEFFPFLGLRTSRREEAKDNAVAAGLDFKYAILPNLILDLTASPDFSEVESDPFIYQLVPSENYLGENRPFFNEGQQYFETAIGNDTGMFHGAETKLFYSRRIGNPKFAAKLSGKTGGVSFGFLGAWNKRDGIPDQFFSVGRVQKDLFENSQIGIYYAGFAAKGDYNRNFGLDYNFNFAKIYYITGMSAFSFNHGDSKHNNGMHFFNAQRAPDAGWKWEFSLQRNEKNLEMRTGFAAQTDFQKIKIGSGYAWRYNQGKIKRWDLNAELNLFQDTGWQMTGKQVILMNSLEFVFDKSFSVYLNGGPKQYQIQGENKQLVWNDSSIDAYGMELELNSYQGGFWKEWTLAFGLDKKGVYNNDFTRVEPGSEINMNAELTVRPFSSLELSAKTGWTRQTVAKTGEKWFDGATYALALHYQLTRELFVNTRLLGETQDNQYSFDFLLGYHFGAGNIAQLTLKKNSRRLDSLEENGYSLTLKISYLLRI